MHKTFKKAFSKKLGRYLLTAKKSAIFSMCEAILMKALKCGTLVGKPCASGYVEGILDEYIHSIVRMYIHVYNYFRVVG